MKTRVELWKNYRLEIEHNISLQEAVKLSDQKYKILKSRLLKLMPNYDERFPSSLQKIEAKVTDSVTNHSSEIDTSPLLAMLSSLDIESNSASNFSNIDNINFSSGDLDDVIKNIEAGQVKNIEYVNPQGDTMSTITTSDFQVPRIKNITKYRIAIDGPSGSGKSTVAKKIASEFDYTYINTGLIYRTIAFVALNNKLDLNDEASIVSQFDSANLELLPNEVVHYDQQDITSFLRTDLISQTASTVAQYPKVREIALQILKKYANQEGIIMDGRDTTFNIMPHADLKIFLDTNPETRAIRRSKQNAELGIDDNYERILAEIKERDHRDRTREKDPLHKTEDAYLIDASELSIEEVCHKISELIREL